MLPQTRRHAYIASLLGIPNRRRGHQQDGSRRLSRGCFSRLREDFLDLAAQLGIASATCIPVSATEGDNIVDPSAKTPWYAGPTLLEHLETVPVLETNSIESLRFPVQLVIRPDSTFRGFAGQIVEGEVRVGDAIVALPSGKTTTVRNIVTFEGNLDSAGQGESVTLELADEIDVSRGDMLVSPEKRPAASNSFAATVVWMSEKPLVIGQSYLAKHTTRSVKARVTNVRHRVNVNTLAHESARDLEMNAIAVVDVETSQSAFLRSLQRKPIDRQLHPDRPDLECHRRGGNDSGRPRAVCRGRTAARSGDTTSPCPGHRAEKFERHGHRPATFLLSGAAVESAERALFADGFETIVLRADSLNRESLLKVSICCTRPDS